MKQHTFNDIVGYSDLEINTKKNYECIIVFIDQLTILMQTLEKKKLVKKYGSESEIICWSPFVNIDEVDESFHRFFGESQKAYNKWWVSMGFFVQPSMIWWKLAANVFCIFETRKEKFIIKKWINSLHTRNETNPNPSNVWV